MMIFFHVFLDPSLYITCFRRKGASGTTLDDSGMCPELIWTCWQRENFYHLSPTISLQSDISWFNHRVFKTESGYIDIC